MKSLEQIIEPIRADLAQFEDFFDRSLVADTEPMNSVIRYVHEKKGKRMRPVLVMLAAKCFGEVGEQTLRAATFVEMVHSATLIHDDVVDDSDQRRGLPSVKARFGNLSAVLAGDYLLAKAMMLLSRPTDNAILNEMLHTAAAMSEGELLQSKKSASYLDIITLKTAMLMRSCCIAGAMSVDAAPEQIQRLSDFGINFGILFQLRDDLLDGENTAEAQSLLPKYLQKTLDSLTYLPTSETLEVLRDLTMFCAEREG